MVVSDPVAPAQAIEGTSVEVRYTVTNLGVGETDVDAWTETVWLCRDRNRPHPGGGDVLLGTFEHTGSLAVGAGYDRAVEVTLPAHVTSGTYYITPWTDSYNKVLEDTLAPNINPDDPNEVDNNNYKARAIDVIGLPDPPTKKPDLVVESVVPDATGVGGTPFTVSSSISKP